MCWNELCSATDILCVDVIAGQMHDVDAWHVVSLRRWMTWNPQAYTKIQFWISKEQFTECGVADQKIGWLAGSAVVKLAG